MAWTRRVDCYTSLSKTCTAALIITSPPTEWVLSIKWLGREADGVNNERIYISAPPIRRHGVQWDTFTLYIYRLPHTYESGPGSSVGIATDYGLDGPGSNSGGEEIFRPSRPTLGPTQPPVKWVPGLSRGVKCGRAVLLTTHHLLVPRSWKSRAIPLPTLWATPGL